MNGVVLFLAALLDLFQGVVGVQSGPEPLPNDTSGMEYRLLANKFLIDNLELQLNSLRNKLKIKTVESEKIYRITDHAVSRLEGTGCKDNEFQCGGHGRQCISELLACDGIKDCVNGQDEDPVYCDVSELRAGISFSGWIGDGKCERASPRNRYFCRLRVTSIDRSSVHRSFMPMTMSTSCRVTVLGVPSTELANQTVNYFTAGRFYIANRRFLMQGHGYVFDCHFTDGSFQVMHCKTYHGATDYCNNPLVAIRDE